MPVLRDGCTGKNSLAITVFRIWCQELFKRTNLLWRIEHEINLKRKSMSCQCHIKLLRMLMPQKVMTPVLGDTYAYFITNDIISRKKWIGKIACLSRGTILHTFYKNFIPASTCANFPEILLSFVETAKMTLFMMAFDNIKNMISNSNAITMIIKSKLLNQGLMRNRMTF